jgi:hypothetical protein
MLLPIYPTNDCNWYCEYGPGEIASRLAGRPPTPNRNAQQDRARCDPDSPVAAVQRAVSARMPASFTTMSSRTGRTGRRPLARCR